MMSDLSCTCGFAEKIEAVLEKIGKTKNVVVAWCPGVFRLGAYQLSGPAIPTNLGGVKTLVELGGVNACDIPNRLLEISDKVKPPEPKERGWRIGDVVGRKDGSLDPKIVKWFSPHEVGVFGFGGDISHSKSEYRNLTIEAEQAGEE